jgi:hypothetical protein
MAVVALSGCASLGGARAPLIAADGGVAKAQIVVAKDASPSTQYAAQELQRFLKEISGAELPIVDDSTPVKAPEIVLGANKHFAELSKGKVDIASLGKEGYVLRSRGKNLLIAGGEPRGTLYGVYGLLEDHLGCRWFTPTVSRIPKRETLALGPLNERVIPTLEYREPFVMDCFDGDWAARNRMNSSAARLEDKHGGKVTYYGFVHTFNQLLPPDQYFDTHPEYFSLIDGKRQKSPSQLCCTNEDVVRLVTEAALKSMRDHPEATVFSVSQNDWLHFCQCDRCTALADAEGTQMAPVLSLVNQVAKAAAQEFPDKLIDTLAYQYTRKAPRTLRPEPNVIVRLCSIECCFSHPFETCDSPENTSFVKDVEEWATKCDRLWVWNYDTSFAHYFMPYPNLRVRDDNIRFYVKNNVRGIFEQDVYTTLNGELSPLSGYLNAKLLWNPDYDENTAINEFLEGVYGPAAKPIRNYIDLIHDKVANENLHMDIWIGPDHPLLNGILEQADALWNEAEAAVAGDSATLERVQAARMSVDYAIIERSRAGGMAIYALDQQAGAISLRPDFEARMKRFVEVAERNGVAYMREGASGAFELYKKDLASLSSVTVMPPREAQAVEGLEPGLLFKGYEDRWELMPDFSKLTPVENGVAKEVSLNVTPRRERVGLTFEGYFLAPADGIYLFYLGSNDGSMMSLDGADLINNDGLHTMTTRSQAVLLKKGYHALHVGYFEAGGKEGLDLSVEGPGMEKRPVPLENLWHAPVK